MFDVSVQIEFPGTRGEIELRSRSHARHGVLLVSQRRRKVLVDCGLDWRDRYRDLGAEAVVLTHAHPDHAGGLRDGADEAVYATADTLPAAQ